MKKNILIQILLLCCYASLAAVVVGGSEATPLRFSSDRRDSSLSKFNIHDASRSYKRNVADDIIYPLTAPPLNMASSVRITKNFLSKFETLLYRQNENKYQRMPADGFSGDRTWGGAFLPKSFLHRLIEVGGEQCASENYEASLPSGVHILTNHVKESTDAHVDSNPTTRNRIENDVGVVFLNTNPDATFFVGGEEFSVEEGKLLMFPGGSVPHHIEMKEGGYDGYVHMLGPFEVGGSHGIVGWGGWSDTTLVWADGAATDHSSNSAKVKFALTRRQLEGEDGGGGQGITSTSTTEQDGTTTGEIYVTGYRDGISPNGDTNHTLEVVYRLEGLDNMNCSESKCFHAEIKDQPNYCDDVKIGQMETDEPNHNDNATTTDDVDDEGTHIILEIMSLLDNVDEAGAIVGVKYINIGKSVAHFFDTPMALHRHDGTILACSIFTEVKDSPDETDKIDDTGEVVPNDKDTSGAISYHVALSTFAVIISSAVALIAYL